MVAQQIMVSVSPPSPVSPVLHPRRRRHDRDLVDLLPQTPSPAAPIATGGMDDGKAQDDLGEETPEGLVERGHDADGDGADVAAAVGLVGVAYLWCFGWVLVGC